MPIPEEFLPQFTKALFDQNIRQGYDAPRELSGREEEFLGTLFKLLPPALATKLSTEIEDLVALTSGARGTGPNELFAVKEQKRKIAARLDIRLDPFQMGDLRDEFKQHLSQEEPAYERHSDFYAGHVAWLIQVLTCQGDWINDLTFELNRQREDLDNILG